MWTQSCNFGSSIGPVDWQLVPYCAGARATTALEFVEFVLHTSCRTAVWARYQIDKSTSAWRFADAAQLQSPSLLAICCAGAAGTSWCSFRRLIWKRWNPPQPMKPRKGNSQVRGRRRGQLQQLDLDLLVALGRDPGRLVARRQPRRACAKLAWTDAAGSKAMLKLRQWETWCGSYAATARMQTSHPPRKKKMSNVVCCLMRNFCRAAVSHVWFGFDDWTAPWLNYSLTALCLDWTFPWLNFALTEPFLDWTFWCPKTIVHSLFERNNAREDNVPNKKPLQTWHLFEVQPCRRWWCGWCPCDPMTAGPAEWSISLVLKLRTSEFCAKLLWLYQKGKAIFGKAWHGMTIPSRSGRDISAVDAEFALVVTWNVLCCTFFCNCFCATCLLANMLWSRWFKSWPFDSRIVGS